MAKVRISPGLFPGEDDKVRKCFLAIDFAKSVICAMDLDRNRGGNAAIEQIVFDKLIEVSSYNVGEENVLKNAISVSYCSSETCQSFMISTCSSDEKESLLEELKAVITSQKHLQLVDEEQALRDNQIIMVGAGSDGTPGSALLSENILFKEEKKEDV